MKKGKIFTNCFLSIWAMMLVVSFTSCSADGSDSNSIDENVLKTTDSSFSFFLKAYSEGQDITSKGDVDNTTLFIFDENNDFYKQITVDRTYPLQRKQILVDCPNSDKITVIAWSGISSENENISLLNQSNIISDLQLSLKQNNGVVSNVPGDLFYGQVVINRSSATTKSASQELKIERKVSSLHFTTNGFIKVYNSREGSFFYKVKNTKSSFNHNGEATGSDVEYIIQATLDKNGAIKSNSIVVLPSSDITIELYRDNEMIFSSKNLKNSEKVSANAGKLIDINFDLSREKSDITVTSWGTVIVDVTI